MKVRKECIRLSLGALIILSAFGITFAQDVNPAIKAYKNWKAKNLTAELSAEGRHIGIGFAVSMSEKAGATINVAVGVGPNVTELGGMRFIVQPVAIKQSAEGKMVFEDLGKPSTINFPKLTNLKPSEDDIIASPRLTMRTPSETGAIRITVKEGASDEGYSVTLALRDRATTAVLGGAVSAQTEFFGKCIWYIGSCGGACGTMCVACNNAAPHLNCVQCTMTCDGGGECTGGGPIPPACTE